MTRMAQELRASLVADKLDSFGKMLHEAWLLKRGLATSISNSRIDAWYETARKHGAIGGKVLGAGGGGFLLVYAHADRHIAIVAALPELERVPFRFAPQGSKIIYVEARTGRIGVWCSGVWCSGHQQPVTIH